ncbi:uncharacterized protein LOC143199663 isoform X2 [Rhynchophorus ferrugineus]|uniref:Osiris 19 n=1 Tax=Rhynchophorus ferrugineus TaxID=354439 RepID=A0A834MF19_RHYFE|nr:hypothetical protein GWI33_007060 [Rhynchophorus ferrugineus]
MFVKICVVLCVVGAAWSAPQQQKPEFWKNTALDSTYFMENVKISANGFEGVSKRSDGDDIEDTVENFIKSNDVTFKLPVIGDVTVDSRKLDDDEISLKLNFGSEVEERGKKSKLKKVFIPILTFVLLKAITVVPFLIGLLALKAWNGLQLSVFSFIIATGLAIFQLCQKLASDHAHAPVVLEHPPSYSRSLSDDGAQTLAYSAYLQ